MMTVLAAGFGRALRALFAGVLLVRRPRPIHPRGHILTGHITWIRDAAPSGVRWIDDRPPAPVPVTARLSRSIGLPPALPDVIGLAFKVDADGATGGRERADIELASTGLGVPSRFMLLPHRSASRARFGTLLPYRGTRGPVLICARPLPGTRLPAGGRALADALEADPWRLRLYHATPRGRWRPFALMTLRRDASADDEALRFDAVRHGLPGTTAYPWVRALRQPSYEMVQHMTNERQERR